MVLEENNEAKTVVTNKKISDQMKSCDGVRWTVELIWTT